MLNTCNPRPRTLFRIAIEESEAWLLGDRAALKAAYPSAREADSEWLRSRTAFVARGKSWPTLCIRVDPAKLKQLGYPGGQGKLNV